MRTIAIVMVIFTLAACGSGGSGGSGGSSEMEMPTSVLPVMPGGGVEMPGGGTETPASTSSQSPALQRSTGLSSSGVEFNINYLDYGLFGPWAIETFADIADVIDQVGYVEFRTNVNRFEANADSGQDFRLNVSTLTGTNDYTYEGPVIGIHYTGGNRRIEGTVRMEYEVHSTSNHTDDIIWISFSDNLPLLTGAIPITEDIPLSRGLGGHRGMVTGEHNGQLRGTWRQGIHFGTNTLINGDTPDSFDKISVFGNIQNKRYIDGSIVTGGYYAIGSVTATDSTQPTAYDLTFMGIFAAPGTAP